MEAIVYAVIPGAKYLFNDSIDQRIKNWPLLGPPHNLAFLLAAYLYFVLRAGPRYMENRKPFDLRGLAQAINLFQIFANAYIVYEMAAAGWFTTYSWLGCEPVDHSKNPQAMRMAAASYAYFLLKLFDFVDTVIYVLRKKTNQISFLHVYHHCLVAYLGWMVGTYTPGGQFTFPEITNSAMHMVMYIYYFMASLGPEYQKYLWWKKYLTTMQMTLFVIQFSYGINMLRLSCAGPPIMFKIYLFSVVSVFLLFVGFYNKTYRAKGDKMKIALNKIQ